MSEVTDLYLRALDEFDRQVRTVTDDQWGDPTPCSEWNVRDLVNHVVSEDLWAPHLLEGKTLDEVGDRFDGDVLGDDPVAAWTRARDGAVEAIEGWTGEPVHTSMGQIPAEEYVAQLFTDHLIHAWDLARGIGADEELDPELVGECYRISLPHEDMIRASGVYGSRLVPPAGADPQARLLALYGRRA